MTIYAINKVCYRILHEPSFRSDLVKNPVAILSTERLSEIERDLLMNGEVGKLFELGAHPYLLSHLSRFGLFGLTDLIYSERIRAAHSGEEDTLVENLS
jgi:hypothetical protein